ncbi:hypothetical protein [Chryseobacterium sp. 52]|nr:hypothetical protein [Chryseobacterium sp. 52]
MYLTDLTQAQWQFRKHDLHVIWNAISYLEKQSVNGECSLLTFPK